jgi:alpha-glucosidase
VESWWRSAVVYQVYVRSFADSDGDGIGDLKGITDRLPHVAGLGADAVWLTPFYRSPMADHGYDVIDQCAVDPAFGSLSDVDVLLATAHGMGLKVIIDLVPNHSSDEHPWFVEALRDPTSPMRDRYLFRPGRGVGPPNDWQSVFGGPAWSQAPDGLWYLHLFDSKQPDFDWRHPAVHEEWRRILRFWLDRGVDGFRIDVAHGLYKQEDLADNPVGLPDEGVLFHASAMPHAWDQPEVVDVYRTWREITDGYDDRVMVGEVFLSSVSKVARFVGADRLHQSFNFPLLAAPFEAGIWQQVISASLAAFEVEGASPTWVLSNHDVVRHATRYGGGEAGRARARAATLTLLALPGSPYLYQGEELGLEQDDPPPESRQDPIWIRSGGAVPGRDGCRTPVPWTAQPPGHGFTTGTPWLPFGPQALTRSVASQEADPTSHLTFYRTALSLRRGLTDHLSREVRWLDAPAGALSFSRADSRGGALVTLLNTGPSGVPLPEGELLLASSPVVGVVPPGTAVWFKV